MPTTATPDEPQFDTDLAALPQVLIDEMRKTFDLDAALILTPKTQMVGWVDVLVYDDENSRVGRFSYREASGEINVATYDESTHKTVQVAP